MVDQSSKTDITAAEVREHLIGLWKRYLKLVAASGKKPFSPATVSQRIVNDPNGLPRIIEGKNFTIERWETLRTGLLALISEEENKALELAVSSSSD